MRPFLSTALPVILLLTAFLGESSAQRSSREAREPSRGVRFVCAAIAANTPDLLKFASGDALIEVQLSTRSPGPLFPVGEDGLIQLGVETGNDTNPFRPLARSRMPEGMRRAIAILLPREERPDGTCYDVLLIDENKIGGGDVYFLNTLPHRCIVKLDDNTLHLESGNSLIHRTRGRQQTHNSSVAIGVERILPESGDSSWDMISASTWRLMPTRAEICIIYLNHEYQRPALKGLTLFIEQGN